MSYTLLGADGSPYPSEVKGQWGGHRGTRIYGRLNCPSALRAIARGGYARRRVFFPDEATAIAAGYRPCANCCPDRYRTWKRGPRKDDSPLRAPVKKAFHSAYENESTSSAGVRE